MRGGAVAGQQHDDEPVKIGGQALADGVLMRTSRAWAIARQDGTVEVGALAPNPFAKIPVLRVVAALFSALKIGIGRGMLARRSPAVGTGTAPAAVATRPNAKKHLNRRLLVILVGLEVAAYAFTKAFGAVAATPAAAAATCIVTFAVLRLATPQSLWRYHGAEHKAVSAHEQGIDMADTAAVLQAPRVHNRCGTNLVFLILIAGFVLQGGVTGWAQIPAFLLLLGATAEIVTLAAKRPASLVGRTILAGGKALQRWVTTAEPTAAEQATGCLALTACLEEHARLVAMDTPSALVATPAAAAA